MRNQDQFNQNHDRHYSPEAQGFSHNNPYDTRTYHTGQGHGRRDYMADGRGSYEQGDLETRWDQYNASHYGQQPARGRYNQPGSYRSSALQSDTFEKDDYRYGSGNREWHLNQDNRESRNDRLQDRYNNPNRYSAMHQRPSADNRDIFERTGDGISRAWNRVTGNRDQNTRHDRDHDYHQSYRNERRSYGVNEENARRYGNKPIQGYERGESYGDDTPERQQRIGDRHNDASGYGANRPGRDRSYYEDF